MAMDIGLLSRRSINHTDSNITFEQTPFRVLVDSAAGIVNTTQLGLLQSNSSDGQTPFADLLLAVFNSILEVFILCAAGYVLARRGILDKKTQKQINRLNVSLFTPALLFSKVAFFLTPAKLKELWVIPIWFVIVTATSMAVGRGLGWAFGLRQSQRSFITAAAMFMNSNALPIALMQSLVLSVPDLAWDSDDNKDTMLGRALTYLTMYSTLGMVVRYSYGVSLLSRADTILTPLGTDIPSGNNEERTPLLQDIENNDEFGADDDDELRTRPSTSTLVAASSSKNLKKARRQGRRQGRGTGTPSSSSSAYPSSSNSPQLIGSPVAMNSPLPMLAGDIPPSTERLVVAERPIAKRKNTTFYNSFPNSPNDSRTDLPTWDDEESTDTDSESESGSDCEGCDADRTEGSGMRTLRERDVEHGPHHQQHCPNHTKHHSSPAFHAIHHWLLRVHLFLSRVLTAIFNFMTVPLWAAVLSLFVASVDGVKHALVNHLQPVNEAVSMAGKCAVPITLVVLGAYFYAGEEDTGITKSASPTPNGVGNGKASVEQEGRDVSGRRKKPVEELARRTTLRQQVKNVWAFVLRPFSSSSSGNGVDGTKNKKTKTKPGENKTVWLAVAARMIITPLILVPLMVLATKADWHAVFEDPVFVVVNTILLCSPPALTLAQITASVSGDAFERLISRTIFWSYCVVTPLVMMASVLLGLWLVKL